MDYEKIQKISHKLQSVNTMIGILNGGSPLRIQFDDGGEQPFINLRISQDDTSTYKLTETMSKALQEYKKDLDKDLASLIR